jgi:hypothetical protein
MPGKCMGPVREVSFQLHYAWAEGGLRESNLSFILMTCWRRDAALLFCQATYMKGSTSLALLLALTAMAGCKKQEPVVTKNTTPPEPEASAAEAQGPTHGPRLEKANAAPMVIPENADTSAALGRLSLELRKYVLHSQKAPKTFEEFVSAAQVQAPPPPPGKKYAIEKGSVILVKR